MSRRLWSPLAITVLLISSGTLAVYAQTRLAAPSYQDPGTSIWNKWAAQGPGALGIMIVNLNNGDDETFYPSVDKAIRQTRRKGIFVIAYTYTGYGSRNPKIIKKKIDAVYRNYQVDGIFFDEAPTECDGSNPYQPTQFLYYQELTNYVRQKEAGARITVLNPGTYSASDCWMGIVNILANWENLGFDSYLNDYVDFPWVHKYPPDRFWHLIYGLPQERLQATLDLAKQRNAGWIYLSENPADPYGQVPVYWSAEAAAVMQQGVQSPWATAWPDSEDSNGQKMKGRVSIRWRAVSGQNWQVLVDTDQNAKTGYHDNQLAIGAEILFEGTAGGAARLWRYTGSGTDWSWTQLAANAEIDFPDPGINLANFDTAALGATKAVSYQIRVLDANYNALYTSYTLPLSLNNTGLVFDILNHPQ